MQNDKVTITATMSTQQAAALSQFFKRLGHDDFVRNANMYHKTELDDMKLAAGIVASALAQQGFSPR